MLHEFIDLHLADLIARCDDKAARRQAPAAAAEHGVPLFIRQLVDILQTEQAATAHGTGAQGAASARNNAAPQVTTARNNAAPQITTVRNNAAPQATATSARKTTASEAATAIDRTAALHGAAMLSAGFTIDQVVHEYGDVCQSITEMAIEHAATISADEFRALNRCLDNAIAAAVTAYGNTRQNIDSARLATLLQRINVFAEEHADLLAIANNAYAAIKTGTIGINGATGTLLTHALDNLHALNARSLPAIRLAAMAEEAPDDASPPAGFGVTPAHALPQTRAPRRARP
jgi:hypothetical protein